MKKYDPQKKKKKPHRTHEARVMRLVYIYLFKLVPYVIYIYIYIHTHICLSLFVSLKKKCFQSYKYLNLGDSSLFFYN